MRFLAIGLALTAACGSDSTPVKQDAAGSGQHDAKPIDSSSLVDAKTFLDAPPGTTALTIQNTLFWCSVTVAGGPAFTDETKVVNVMPGTIALTATPVTGFMLSSTMWHHTAGDTGNGEAGNVTGNTSATTVVVGSTAKCVWVCCPSTTTPTDCNVPDPCP